MNNLVQYLLSKRIHLPLCIIFAVLLSFGEVCAQEKPPKPISIYVNPAQGLMFGAFCTGAIGGTVTVTSGGGRSSTGSIILVSLGYAFSPAIIQVQGNVGTLVNINNGTDVSMTGSNGGSINLHLESSSTGTPFIINTVAWMDIRIGGTLTIGVPGANPAGSYNGSFNVTFIQQ